MFVICLGTFECPGYYRCHSKMRDDRNVCLTSDQICDGINDCPLADDELFCGMFNGMCII